MAKEKAPSKSVFTPEGEALWPSIVTARAGQFASGKNDPRFEFKLIVDQGPAEALLTELKELARGAYPSLNEKFQVTLENGDLKSVAFPCETGERFNAKRVAKGKEAFESVVGKLIFSAHAGEAQRPTCCDLAGKPIENKLIRGGDICRLQLNLVAYSTSVFTGITAYLNAVLLVKAGPRRDALAGDVFKQFLNQSAVDPFASRVSPFSDDEIPF